MLIREVQGFSAQEKIGTYDYTDAILPNNVAKLMRDGHRVACLPLLAATSNASSTRNENLQKSPHLRPEAAFSHLFSAMKDETDRPKDLSWAGEKLPHLGACSHNALVNLFKLSTLRPSEEDRKQLQERILSADKIRVARIHERNIKERRFTCDVCKSGYFQRNADLQRHFKS